jgi:hypothetical protein
MDNDAAVVVERELKRLGGQVDTFCAKQKERYTELDTKNIELQARLLELEQRAARRGDPGGDPGTQSRHSHSACGRWP